jgi:hypothetical protein
MASNDCLVSIYVTFGFVNLLLTLLVIGFVASHLQNPAKGTPDFREVGVWMWRLRNPGSGDLQILISRRG